MLTPVEYTAKSSLDVLTSVLTQIWTWFGNFLETLSNEPVLLIGLAFMVGSLVIGLVFSAVRGRGKRKG